MNVRYPLVVVDSMSAGPFPGHSIPGDTHEEYDPVIEEWYDPFCCSERPS
jgi:hypothetical protein